MSLYPRFREAPSRLLGATHPTNRGRAPTEDPETTAALVKSRIGLDFDLYTTSQIALLRNDAAALLLLHAEAQAKLSALELLAWPAAAPGQRTTFPELEPVLELVLDFLGKRIHHYSDETKERWRATRTSKAWLAARGPPLIPHRVKIISVKIGVTGGVDPADVHTGFHTPGPGGLKPPKPGAIESIAFGYQDGRSERFGDDIGRGVPVEPFVLDWDDELIAVERRQSQWHLEYVGFVTRKGSRFAVGNPNEGVPLPTLRVQGILGGDPPRGDYAIYKIREEQCYAHGPGNSPRYKVLKGLVSVSNYWTPLQWPEGFGEAWMTSRGDY